MAPEELLAEAVTKAVAGEPLQLSVREFISYWHAKRRGYRVVNRINRDLDRAGLVTVPDFDQTGIDSRVVIAPRPAPQPDEPEVAPREYGLPVGTLPSATAGVLHVNPNDTLQLAYTRMQINDYSQLPVMTGERSLKGAVTWRSIAEALLRNRDATLADAVVRVETVRYDEDLLGLVPDIVEHEFVLVTDETGRVTGIVTTADVSELFAERALTFLQLGEIDQRLRDLIEANLSIDEIQLICDKGDGSTPIADFDEMSMGDYEQVLSNPEYWERIGWPLDRVEFHHLLNEVRGVRNDVMHFNPDPIEDDRLSRVQGLVELLRNHG